jgi:GT2 family glycosyltransferase
MNAGLRLASNLVVLFLDDDIIPGPGLIGAHAARHAEASVSGVVGKVLQPGQETCSGLPQRRGAGIWRDLGFPFNSDTGSDVFNCMAGNLSVKRERALAAGGCDESFKGVAYRFETEFCRRLIRSNGRLVYEPSAWINHLQAARGGTRAYGNPLTSADPAHSVGDYYFAFRDSRGMERLRYIAHRMLRSVRTRFHFTHPWWIPVKLSGEIRGLLQAYRLSRQPPALATKQSEDTDA